MAFQIPTDREIFDFGTSINWFDDEGFFVTVSSDSERNYDNIKESMRKTHAIFKGEKHCTLIDSTLLKPMSREARLYAASEFKKLYKAMAIVSSNPLSRTLANFMFAFTGKDELPRRIFASEEQARAWLRVMKSF
ncbi:MAG: hypothetical protein N4A41_13605 [Crocinitomicaceae bacterium]|jgi:hypothetical protein|nr:hypothetical protein [Crocinitomicaceae bacterium]